MSSSASAIASWCRDAESANAARSSVSRARRAAGSRSAFACSAASPDAVIICAPQTPETTGLFDEAMFRRMKPSAYFINIGRGKIVRLAALERAVGEGWIAGAGVDVFETEPLPTESPLWGMENVVITPHSAGHGPHLEERRLRVVLENVRRFVAGEPLENVADKALWY